MIAGTFVRALPGWVLWLALTALVAASAGWGYTRGLSAERAERDRIVSEFAQFRERVSGEGRQAQARAAAEITRQEAINEQTHTAYGIALDRLRDMQRARIVRQPADSPACPGGGGVPADATPVAAADGTPADHQPDPAGTADGAWPPPGVTDQLIERCQHTTLQCLWLQNWVRKQLGEAVP